MKKYIIYARVASRKQIDRSSSIDYQIETLKELAHRHNVEVTEVYTELGSSNKKRKKFNEMIDNLFRGEADGILCCGLDRLSRSGTDYQRIIALINLKDIKIITPTQVYGSDADQMFLMNLEIAINSFSKTLISQRIKVGIKKRKEVK